MNCLALSLFVLLFPTADPQDGMDLLRRVADASRSIQTYDLVRVTSSDVVGPAGSNHRDMGTQRVRCNHSGKCLFESNDRIVTLDGRQSLEYHPSAQEYLRRNSDGRAGMMYGFIDARLGNSAGAIVTGHENCELTSGPVPCTVVETQGWYPVVTFWIDTERLVVLKMVSKQTSQSGVIQRDTESLRSLTLNAPLSDKLFQFTPPDGAVEVQEFVGGKRSPLIGQPVPSFELKDADGVSITPATLRGRIAVLNFTYGNGPSEAQAFLELLHREMGDHGISVLMVAMKPSKDWIAGLAKEGYTVPVATDAEGAAAQALGLEGAIGFVVFDAEGTLRYARSGESAFIQRDVMRTLNTAGVL